MTGLHPCVICRSIASARCVKCGGYICDTICLEAHRMDERGKFLPPSTSKGNRPFTGYKYGTSYRDNPWDDAA